MQYTAKMTKLQFFNCLQYKKNIMNVEELNIIQNN